MVNDKSKYSRNTSISEFAHYIRFNIDQSTHPNMKYNVKFIHSLSTIHG